MQYSDNIIPFPGTPPFGPGDFDFASDRIAPVLLKPGRQRQCFVVRLDLDDVRPPIWRRLRLASDMTLDQVHDVIQTAMGWQDCHLHEFQMGPEARDFRTLGFRTPCDVQEGDTEGPLEEEVRLDQVIAEPNHRLFYTYDFGDSWHHTIKLEKVEAWVDGDLEAVCVTGRRACPPEDVGGPYGYQEVLDALAGQVSPGSEGWMAEKLDWMPPEFDPERFDLDMVNALLAQPPFPPLDLWHHEIGLLLANDRSLGATGLPLLVQAALSGHDEAEDLSDEATQAATRDYRILLDTIGSGVKMTGAGYLPPATVGSLCGALGTDRALRRGGNREIQAPVVHSLRESAMGLGLLRKANGCICVTKAGAHLHDKPRALLAHIGSRIPLGRGFERIAGLLALMFAACGKDIRASRFAAAEIASGLGWASEDMADAVVYSSAPTLHVLRHLCPSPASPQERADMARVLLRREVTPSRT